MVHDLLAQGKTHSQICKTLGLSARTVRKFIRAATAEQVITGPVPRFSRIDRFAPYLQERWNQGCTDAAQRSPVRCPESAPMKSAANWLL